MSPERLTAWVLALGPLITIIGAIAVALIQRPTKPTPPTRQPMIGMAVETADDLVTELRDRNADAEDRERAAWRERDAYRAALQRANHALSDEGLPIHHPDL